MKDLLTECERVLREGGIASSPLHVNGRVALGLEGVTVIGFLLLYSQPSALLAHWRDDLAFVVRENQFSLRRARAKAWNTYAILLSEGAATVEERVLLRTVEEDLVATRKIARDGVADPTSLRQALLPLLPLQHAPMLEAVDMIEEIRLRTSELPPAVVDAFLSNVPEEAQVQIFEDEQ